MRIFLMAGVIKFTYFFFFDIGETDICYYIFTVVILSWKVEISKE